MSLLLRIKTLIAALSSRAFLLWMIGGWVVYYVFSAIWVDEAFGSFAVGIATDPLVQFPFALFLVSGYMNLVRASKEVLKSGRLQFAAWVVMPIGVLLFLTGFFISLYSREAGQRIIGEGDIIKPPWVTETYHVKDIAPGLKKSLLDIESDKGIFLHEPTMTLVDRNSNSHVVGAFPPTKIDGTYYHILNFGIAPGIMLYKDDSVRFKGYMPLKVLMPGSSDYFEIGSYPYRFLVSLQPENVARRRDGSALRYDLKAPVYNMQVFRDEKIIAEGNSREGILFDDYTVKFTDHTYWVMLEAAKTPGMPVLIAGILLIVIGVPLWLLRTILQFRSFS
jgi:hypothetical protein